MKTDDIKQTLSELYICNLNLIKRISKKKNDDGILRKFSVDGKLVNVQTNAEDDKIIKIHLETRDQTFFNEKEKNPVFVFSFLKEEIVNGMVLQIFAITPLDYFKETGFLNDDHFEIELPFNGNARMESVFEFLAPNRIIVETELLNMGLVQDADFTAFIANFY